MRVEWDNESLLSPQRATAGLLLPVQNSYVGNRSGSQIGQINDPCRRQRSSKVGRGKD